jgi:hypothetical protein
MKSFSTVSFVAALTALALAPSAFADKFLTTITYLDSDCTYVSGYVTTDVEISLSVTSCADLVVSTCTANEYGGGGSNMATCGNSLLGEIGYDAYRVHYTDSLCEIPYKVISMACACCTGNELYPCDSFHSALAPFLCVRRLPSWATILARPKGRRPP